MTRPAEAELAAGIECYVTMGEPCQGVARSAAEDFAVEERVSLEGLVSEPRPDYLPLYRVEKRSIDTMHMAAELSTALKSRVSYAGLKDKKAVSVQYVTPTSRRAERPSRVVGKDFAAELVGYLPRPMNRGALVGNSFSVVLRDCCPEIGARIEEACGLARERKVPNFYGLQRFGTSGGGTHRVGRELVRGDFEGAVRQLLLSSPHADPERRRMIEEAISGRGGSEIAELIPARSDVEAKVARELGRHPGEWARALRAVPVGLRRLYVHAYQSWLFNRALSRAVMEGEDISAMKGGDNWAQVSDDGMVTSEVRGVRDVPTAASVPMVQVVGYAYRNYGSRFDSRIEKVLEEEGVRPAQFYIKEMQEVSAEGGFRRPHIAVGELSWEASDGAARLRFSLGKGQYATVLLREIIKPRDPAASGL